MNLSGKLRAVLYVFVGLVLFGILSLAGGRREFESYPSSDHYGPSGLRALSELLTRNGYRIRIDHRTQPKFAADETVIAVLRVPNPFSGGPDESSQNEKLSNALEDHVVQGGNALIGYVPGKFKDVTQNATKVSVTDPFRSATKVMYVANSVENAIPSAKPSLPLWEGTWTATAYIYPKGRLVGLTNALPLTNRFLDREQNADVVLSTIQTLAKPGSTIVFAEGGFEPIEPGFLGTIGPWAVSGWYQMLFLFAVIAYCGGKRLGLPDFRRIPQRSSRDLLDATTDTLQRSKSTRIAVRTALSNADVWLANWQIQNRTRETPSSLVDAMARGRAALMEKKLPAAVAVSIVKDLDREIQDMHRSK